MYHQIVNRQRGNQTMRKPNILFVFADQLRSQSLGFMGEKQVATPYLDAFAKDGLIFTNAISSCPLCSPYRGCLFTGKYPLSNGVFTNCKTGLDIMLQEGERCLSDVLHDAGYQNGYIGKWHLDNPEVNYCKAPLSGAIGWDAYTPPGNKRHHFDFWYSYGASDNHLEPHYWMDTPNKIQVNQWSVEHETDKAIQYINEHKNKPFALFVAYNPPHSPYDLVPQKYFREYENTEISLRPNVETDNIRCHTDEQFDYKKEDLEQITKQYFAAITGIDDNFGRLLNTLKENQIDDDTIVIFTSDHGDMLGSHGLMAKHVWYEEAINIPFVIRWNKGPLKQGKTDIVLEPTDIMPTLLNLVKIEVPVTVEGKDISNVLMGNGYKETDKVGFLCAFPGRDIFLEAFKKQGKNPKDFGWRGIRTQGYTFVIDLGYYPENTIPKRYLYDLKSDPYQLHPIQDESETYGDVMRHLEEQLMAWLRTQNDGILKYLEHH